MRDSLTELTATPYFKSSLNDYASCIVDVTEYVISNYSTIPSDISRRISGLVWAASKYLRGSVSTEIPYEVEYTLSLALKDWVNVDCVITTALTDEMGGYHCYPLDTWKEIQILLPQYNTKDFSELLVQIALPRIYKHKPLYYTPLYHELGHFIDAHFSVIEATLLSHPMSIPAGTHPVQVNMLREMEKNHRKEYFADLFSACYVGVESSSFLQEIAPSAQASISHPATDQRSALISDFLDGKANPVVDVYQDVLKKLGLPCLEKRFELPDITESFENFRPYTIKTDAEAHGIFQSSWSLFRNATQNTVEPWSKIEATDISRVINDLTEKSIRNRVIVEKWK